MNYEELLAAKNDGKLNKTQLPIGEYYRTMTDGKYRGQVDIRKQLIGNIVFTGGLKSECESNKTLNNPHQLHFQAVEEGGEIVRLMVEQGTFMSFEQLLNDTPAVMGEKDFVDRTLEALVDITTYLHEQGIRHLCYSPRTVLARKGDHSAMLLSHGSFYQSIGDLEDFFGEDVQFVAPEVLSHGTIDDRCDVYSIGKFMQSLFTVSEMPIEYKLALKKATSTSPEDRYDTPKDMLKAVQQKRGTMKSIITLIIALVIALICVGIYFDMFPETQPVEFVKPAPRQPTDDLLDDGFDPTELGVVSSGDTLDYDDEAAQRDFQAKAEQIFRKKYEQEADRILSKIYNKEYMSNSEKKFTAESQSTIDELMKKQQELGEEASLTPERAQLIATEIIERITEQKKKEMGGTNSLGIQK